MYVHNDYLNTLCEWGVVGMGLIAAAVALLYKGAIKTWSFVRHSSNHHGGHRSNKSAFVAGASLGLLALLLHSFLDFNMHIPANAIVAVTLMALITAHWRFATERYWYNPGRLWEFLYWSADGRGVIRGRVGPAAGTRALLAGSGG